MSPYILPGLMPAPIVIQQAIQAVALYFNENPELLFAKMIANGRDNKDKAIEQKHIVFYLLRKHNRDSIKSEAIADNFNLKNHSSVLHGAKKIKNFTEKYKDYAIMIEKIETSYLDASFKKQSKMQKNEGTQGFDRPQRPSLLLFTNHLQNDCKHAKNKKFIRTTIYNPLSSIRQGRKHKGVRCLPNRVQFAAALPAGQAS